MLTLLVKFYYFCFTTCMIYLVGIRVQFTIVCRIHVRVLCFRKVYWYMYLCVLFLQNSFLAFADFHLHAYEQPVDFHKSRCLFRAFFYLGYLFILFYKLFCIAVIFCSYLFPVLGYCYRVWIIFTTRSGPAYIFQILSHLL